MIHDIIFAGAGFVIGAFCPSVLRKIKAFFTKEATAATTAVTTAAAAAVKKV